MVSVANFMIFGIQFMIPRKQALRHLPKRARSAGALSLNATTEEIFIPHTDLDL